MDTLSQSTGTRFQRVDSLWRWDGENGKHILVSAPKKRTLEILNPVAAKIFLLCDGEHTVEDIIDSLESCFPAEPFRIREDVCHFIRYLHDIGLVYELS